MEETPIPKASRGSQAWALGLGGLALLGLGLGLALGVLGEAFRLRPVPKGACTPGPLPPRAELFSNGAVELPLCRPARLRLRLEGTLARGQGPWAAVAEGERTLWQGEVRGEKTVEVRLTGEGVAVLAFTNDFYQPPEDRNLYLRGLEVLPP